MVNSVQHRQVGPIGLASMPARLHGDHGDPLAIRPELLEEAKAFLEEYAEDFTQLASL